MLSKHTWRLLMSLFCQMINVECTFQLSFEGSKQYVVTFAFRIMFHLQRLKCFKSKYPHLNVFTERSVWLAQNDWANLRQSWTPCTNSIVYIYSDLLLTHIIIYDFICFSCCTYQCAVQVVVSFILLNSPECFQKTSEISSFSIYHSPGLWQSVYCVSFLSIMVISYWFLLPVFHKQPSNKGILYTIGSVGLS